MDEYEYECTNCNEVFKQEEPPHDGAPVCEECRYEASGLRKKGYSYNV